MTTMNEWLSPEEAEALLQRSDIKAGALVVVNWLIVAAALWACVVWPNPFTWLVSIFVIGARQLGLAILMHEAGHNTLFSSRAVNHFVGQWFCAYPILSDMPTYATSHRVHHTQAGSVDDPDLPNYQAYPVSVASFKRKMIRDLTGQTGVRNLLALFKRDGGDLMVRDGGGKPPIWGGVAANGLLFALLFWLGVGELYAAWVVAYLVVYPTLARIRQLAEHAAVADLYDPDPRQHTRTTRANWLERLFIAPNHVHYHCEHHFAPAVPGYRLPKLHALLRDKGFYRDHPSAVADGYRDVLRQAVPG